MRESHPARAIVGEVNSYLAGRCIVLGITGSVSAYRSIDLGRWLVRRGARVIFASSRAALDLIGEKLMYWATGEKPVTTLTGEVEHVELARECDGMILAPATLNSIVKLSLGVADSPVTLIGVTLLGEGKRVVVVPAMHANMERTRQYREAINRLKEMGVLVIPPQRVGDLAKYPPVEIVGRASAAFISRGRDLVGKRVLVTAGATREWLDPVRFISNPSSGRMGFEVAIEAWARGADVYLVHGHVEVSLPHMCRRIPVNGTYDMCRTVRRLTEEIGFDYFISTAAPVDFKPAATEAVKIKSGQSLELLLVPTPKVLEAARGRVKRIVAFAAETMPDREELIKSAREKMEKYSADIIVANDVSSRDAGFASDLLDAVILWRHEDRLVVDDLGKVNKELLARRIIDTLVVIEEVGSHDADNA